MSGPGPGAAPNPPSPPEGRRERRAAGPAVPPAGPRSLPAPAAQRSPGAPLLPSAPPPPAGGYEAFSSACSELCTKPAAPTGLSLPLSASSAPGSADSGCSSCGTPLYDQVSWGGGGERGGGLLRRALCDPPSEANRFSALFLL